MKNECSIVRDLLPLYADQLTSEETDEWIEEHLKGCEECRKALGEIRGDIPAAEKTELPLKQFGVTYQKKRRELFLLAAAAACTILLSIFSFLSAPQFLDAKQAIASVIEYEDNILVEFTDQVRHYSVTSEPGSQGDIEASNTLQCWTTAYDQMFEKGTAYSAELPKINLWYANNRTSFDSRMENSGDTLLYGSADYGRVTLRRLTLNYYLLLSLGLSAVFFVLWLINKNKAAGSTVFNIFLIPFSWLCASIIVGRGFGNATFSLMRDLILIVLLAVSILITARLALKYRKEYLSVKNAEQ